MDTLQTSLERFPLLNFEGYEYYERGLLIYKASEWCSLKGNISAFYITLYIKYNCN